MPVHYLATREEFEANVQLCREQYVVSLSGMVLLSDCN